MLRILAALFLLIPVSAALAAPTGATTGRAAAAAGQPMVWGWGANDFDALIPGASGLIPTPIDGTDGVIAVAGTLALRADHTVLSWGYNSMGEGGMGTISQTSPVHQVPGLTDVSAISQGTFDIALKADGTVWTWGDDEYGQLGRPATDNPCGSSPCSAVPGQVPGLDDVRSVVAGNNYGFAIKRDGSVWAWGVNSGRFGNGDTTSTVTPTQVTQLTGVVSIAIGEKHAVAVKADGTVWTWGFDDFGQLGVPMSTACASQYPCGAVPVQVPGLTDMVAVTAGTFYSVALKADGTVWLWGGDFTGQPPVAPGNMIGGDLSASQVIDPQDPTGYLTHVTAISANWNGQHTLVLKSDGTVWGWGSDNSWQINTQAPCLACYNFADNVPTRVVGIEGATALAAGSHTSFAIAPVPDLSASPPGDDFGYVAFGSTTAPNTFSVTNNSVSPVHVAGITLANAPNQATASFSVVSDQCSGTELQPGQSCQVSATLSVATPASLAQIEPMALVTITEDAPEHRQVEQVLAGEGMVSLVNTSSAALDFGDQPLSGQTTPLSLTLSPNQYVSGGESLAMHLRVVGPDAGDFSETDTCSTPLTSSAQSCSVQVTFAPSAAGPRQASLIIDSKDGVSSEPSYVIVEIQNSVPLSGYGGTPPTATATPTAVPSDTPIPSPTTTPLPAATVAPSDTPIPSPTASPRPTATVAPSVTPDSDPAIPPSPTAIVAPPAIATPVPPAPPPAALPSPVATSIPVTPVAPPPAATPTSPGTPAPPPTDTAVANGHEAPISGTPDPTSTNMSTSTPVPVPTTAAHHSLTVRSALSVVAQVRVTSGQTLTVHADTAAHARIRVALQVVARRTTMVRLKMKVREVQRAVTLYRVGNTRVADGRGRAMSRLRVTYKLASPTRAVLLVTARVHRVILARNAWVTIVPPARHMRHQQSASRTHRPSQSQDGKQPMRQH